MKIYTLNNYKDIPQISLLSDDERQAIEVVARVFPFKVNEHVVAELIDWSKGSDDPMFRATFPHRDMLAPDDFTRLLSLIKAKSPAPDIEKVAQDIRDRMNPDASSQHALNIPIFNGKSLNGIQHKYAETILLFPSEGQNCHTWCSFCFRWNQFVNSNCQRFSGLDPRELLPYIEANPQLTDVLFTGGDPMIMSASALDRYIDLLLKTECSHIRNIRFGTKLLAWNPQRFFADKDSEKLLDIFTKILNAGKNVVIVAHWSNPRELANSDTRKACAILRQRGVQLRGQTPLLKGINDDSITLAQLWREQTALGCLPYYMFIVRDTGAHKHFEIPLVRAWELYRDSIGQVSGLARTVRGPVMSCSPGKIIIDGIVDVGGRRAFVLRYLQARRPELVGRPFLAKYHKDAMWWNSLHPFGKNDEMFFQ